MISASESQRAVYVAAAAERHTMHVGAWTLGVFTRTHVPWFMWYERTQDRMLLTTMRYCCRSIGSDVHVQRASVAIAASAVAAPAPTPAAHVLGVDRPGADFELRSVGAVMNPWHPYTRRYHHDHSHTTDAQLLLPIEHYEYCSKEYQYSFTRTRTSSVHERLGGQFHLSPPFRIKMFDSHFEAKQQS